jgi:ribosome-associated toxin RatA of RatAB toxin-antitoxin module
MLSLMSSVLARRTLAPALLAAALALAHGSASAQEISIRTARDGDFVTVSASALMRVDQRIAWAVLSDYDHLANFIPDVKSSRVVSRDGHKLLVEQIGEVGFIFYKQAVTVMLEVHEEPLRRITARGVEGNVKGLESHYELHASGEEVRLDYAGRFDPDFAVPPLIGMPVMRRVIERRFRAMVEEIQRRDALARGALKQ